MNNQQPQEEHLLDYLQIILKRKYIILACLVVTLTTSIIANYVMEPIYEAKTRILIDKKMRSISPVTGVSMDEGYQLLSDLQTHFDLITSYPVLERVYNKLFLNKSKKGAIKEEAIPTVKKVILFITRNVSKAKNFILDLVAPEEKKEDPFMNDPELRTLYKIRSLRNKIKVEQVKKSNLLDLVAKHKNPKLARDIANGFAQAYIEYNRSSSFDATKGAIDWLSEQLDSMKTEIKESEKNFYAFKKKEGIFSIKGKQRIHNQKIAQTTNDYSTTKSKRLATSAALKGLSRILDEKEYDNKSILGTVDNPLLEKLHRDLINQEIELSGLKKTFKYRHSQIIAIENKIEQTSEKYEQELQRTLHSLKSENTVLQDKERTLLSTIKQYENQALDLSKKEMEYTMLEREVETNKKLYNLLFNNFTEANVIKAVPTSNISLIEEALYPLSPVEPNKMMNLILGIVLGLMMGLGLSFFLEYLNRALNTPEDVVSYLELPLLSSIPKIPAKKW